MILYHGSNTGVKFIDLDRCRPYKDFGKGFYLTTIKPQAEKMAARTVRLYGGSPAVSIFEFNDSEVNNLSQIRFVQPTEEWVRFVLNNRNKYFCDFNSKESNHDNKYDIAIGPVANDDLSLLFRLFSDGIVDIETLKEEMKFKQLSDQYSFHTKEAVALLKYIGDK